MRDGHLTFLIVPEDESDVRRVRLSYRTLRWLGVLAGVLVGVVLVGLGTYGGLVGRAGRLALLERENRRLEGERAKVGEIVENLERSERTYQQIRSLAGLEDLPSLAAAIAIPVADEENADELVSEEPAIAEEPASAEEPPPAEGRPVGSPADTPPADTPPADTPPADTPLADTPPADATPAVEDATPSGWPLAVKGFVTARFEGLDGHTGVDIAVPRETPVLATAPGRVSKIGSDSILGHYVVVAHEAGLETLYAHNARLLVERGQRVERAEAVAYSGSSGRSTAPHLHYEIRKAGRPVDPDPYLH